MSEITHWLVRFECGCSRPVSTEGISGPVSALCTKHLKPVARGSVAWAWDPEGGTFDDALGFIQGNSIENVGFQKELAATYDREEGEI